MADENFPEYNPENLYTFEALIRRRTIKLEELTASGTDRRWRVLLLYTGCKGETISVGITVKI